LYYNLASAQAKAGNTEEAIRNYEQFKSMSENPERTAMANYDIGNIFVENEQWEQAVDYYKKSLRHISDDSDAKYNYELAQKNKDKKEQKEKKKDQKKDPEKKKDEKKQQNQQNKDQQKKKRKKQRSQQNKIGKKQAEKLLQALGQKEKELLKKFKKQKVKPAD